MNFRFTVLETSLNRAEFRWKWLRFLRYTFALGVVLSLLVLCLGFAILAGWVVSKEVALTTVLVLGGVGFLAWAVVLISVLADSPDRRWLAASMERVDRRFLDRLNTLLFLENRAEEVGARNIALRIAKQAQQVANLGTTPPPFPASRTLAYFAAFAVALTATVLLFQVYSPWRMLVVAQKAKPAAAPQRESSLELPAPATNNIEDNRPWGEVRITDPGADLKVTKVDVVPLQIEAAANQNLNQVGWYSAINGGKEDPHALPAPKEPKYAVYQPTIYLDELNLADWDVMTYYAKADAAGQNSYASEVYFLEVRPFREDIMKMPGGQGGKPYQSLNEISTLINRQQHVIRQTHQHLQRPPEQENLRAQDRKKLAEAEQDLSASAQHLYAKMATEMENKPIGDALDNLAKARQSLDGAGKSLQANTMDEAQNQERKALSDLVASRKMFQKAISDNPDAFDESKPEDESAPPVADNSKKLSQMAEFRNAAKAAQDFVRKTLEQQKALEQKAKSGSTLDHPRLGNQEQALRQELKDFQEQHPDSFRDSQAQSDQAQNAMAQAANSLRSRNSNARQATEAATRQLEQLSQSLEKQAADRQLANAYKLKKMLDEQIAQLARHAEAGKDGSKPAGDQKPGQEQANNAQGQQQQQGGAQSNSGQSPGSRPDDMAKGAPGQQLQATARDAQETVNQLRNTAEQEPTRDAFGEPLREALRGQNKVDLDAKLKSLEATGRTDQANAADVQRRAAEAKDALGKVSKAFEQSQPRTMQAARSKDSLNPGDQDGFSQGLGELDSLLKQLENNRQVPRDQQSKQGRQALANLQRGMRGQSADDPRGQDLLVQLERMLKEEKGLDIGDLKKLVQALQHFSTETSEQMAKKEDQPDITNIDPSRLPPAYRGRIQRYFQKLSEN